MKLRSFFLRAATICAGLALKRAFNWPFDYLLYPVVLFWLGPVWGGLVLMALSVPLNLLVIKGYDWAKVDWLGIESLKKRFRPEEG